MSMVLVTARCCRVGYRVKVRKRKGRMLRSRGVFPLIAGKMDSAFRRVY